MKILFLTRLFYPHVGGVEKHVYEVSKILREKGHKIIIFTEELTENQRSSLTQEIEKTLENFVIQYVPTGGDGWFKKFRIWKWMWSHRRMIQSSDLVHCHDVFFWYLPFRFLYRHKKVFTTFHGYENYPIRGKAIFYRKIFELLSYGTICVGEFMKKWYKAKPDFVFYGGVHLPTNQDKLEDKNSAIFIGRLDEQTGIDMYTEAVKIIRKRYPKFTLTVYGDGQYNKKIVGEGIKLKGFDQNADKYLSEFHLAFVSRYLAILEAMANMRPVIAVYDNPVKEDYLRMTPFANCIAVVNSPHAIGRAVDDCIKNQTKTKKLVEQGYRLASKSTWEKVVDTYLELWR